MKSESRRVSVGLVGLGTVGQGVVALLSDSESQISAKTGLDLRLARICDTDLARPRDV